MKPIMPITVAFTAEIGEDELLDHIGALNEKNRFNRQRADHKLENRAAGGKRY